MTIVCSIGSSNLDMRSFTLNEEDMVLFYDRNVAAPIWRGSRSGTSRDSTFLSRRSGRSAPRSGGPPSDSPGSSTPSCIGQEVRQSP